MRHFIEFASENIKPDFWIWLGDNPAHNFWEQKPATHLRSLKEISERIGAKYGKVGMMYPVLGNHEGFPCDEFDIHGGKNQWILDEATTAWQQWLTPECK